MPPEVIPLSHPYPSRRGVPVVDRVALSFFTRRYFTHCMSCTFCNDDCCRFGTDIGELEHERIMEYADELEARLGVSRSEWLEGSPRPEPDLPGGVAYRTQVVDGLCVFHNRRGRGCLLHLFALERGIDYREIKPAMCWLFGAIVDLGLLRPAEEVLKRSIVCIGEGPTVYQAARDEVAYLFGPELIQELDAIERRVTSAEGVQGN